MNLKKITVCICTIWLAIMVIMIVGHEFILKNGKEILLKTIPVDPRDLVMGDYVILNYDISRLPDYYEYVPNKEVYVVLHTNNENIAGIDYLTDRKPSNKLYLKGRMSKCNTIFPFWKNGQCINYGIESYYVKERTGKQLERDLRNGTLVKVVVDKNGNAKVRGFVKD